MGPIVLFSILIMKMHERSWWTRFSVWPWYSNNKIQQQQDTATTWYSNNKIQQQHDTATTRYSNNKIQQQQDTATTRYSNNKIQQQQEITAKMAKQEIL